MNTKQFTKGTVKLLIIASSTTEPNIEFETIATKSIHNNLL